MIRANIARLWNTPCKSAAPCHTAPERIKDSYSLILLMSHESFKRSARTLFSLPNGGPQDQQGLGDRIDYGRACPILLVQLAGSAPGSGHSPPFVEFWGFPLRSVFRAMDLRGQHPDCDFTRTVHESFFWIFTHELPSFGITPYFAYAAAPQWYLPRNLYLIVGLAPLLVLSVLGSAALFLVPIRVFLFILYAVTIYASGAVGDIVQCILLCFMPTDVLIRDSGRSFTVYRFTSLNAPRKKQHRRSVHPRADPDPRKRTRICLFRAET